MLISPANLEKIQQENKPATVLQTPADSEPVRRHSVKRIIPIPPRGQFVLPTRAADMAGQVFDRLTAIYYGGKDNQNNVMWVCECQCGKETIVRGFSLRDGSVRSCGCLQNEIIAAIGKENATHGRTETREYETWQAIKHRCYYLGHNRYHRYGGRGIVVCDRWLHSFEAFFEDMGPRPGDGYSIERIDSDGPYSPENCRWATATEQQNNKVTNVHITHNGVTKTMAEWARCTGISESALRRRLRTLGWSVSDALEKPIGGEH